jgi:hypothetical protein
MAQDKFWLIWSPQGTVNPTETYYSKELARQKARELSSCIQESDFYIVEATHHYKADINVIETSFEVTSEESLAVEPKFKVGDIVKHNKFGSTADDFEVLEIFDSNHRKYKDRTNIRSYYYQAFTHA